MKGGIKRIQTGFSTNQPIIGSTDQPFNPSTHQPFSLSLQAMEGFLNILDREDILRRLGTLKSDAVASFGRMSAQHMVEHLVFIMRISNGKLPHKLYYSDEKAAKIKAYTINTDKEIVVGFRAPMLPDEPVPLNFPGLHEAIEQLQQELTDFDQFFRENPYARPTNPTMGPLDFEEWIIFHNKHFTHHFRQFQLS